MEWKEKSITETVETETKDHQVRNLEPGTGNHEWTRKREAVVELTDGQAQGGREVK